MNEQKPIFYSWDSYVADILTNNHNHDKWRNLPTEGLESGIVAMPCIFNEVDPKIDKHRRRPIGNKNIENQTVYFCLSHFVSKVVNRNTLPPPSCGKSSQKINCVMPFDYKTFNLDSTSLMGIWSALPPAFSTEKIVQTKPSIHVHLRNEEYGHKSIDDNFEAVIVKSNNLTHCNSFNNDMYGHEFLEIEITPPSIFSLCLAYYKRQTVYSLTCTYCGAWHTDLGVFNLNPHKKHLCGSCGYFFDVDLVVSCSNALAALPNNWNPLKTNKMVIASKSLSIKSTDYDRIDIWAWSPAALWTMAAPEVINGIHIHAYKNGIRVIDETYGQVEFNGGLLEWQDLLIQSLRNCDIHDKEVVINDLINSGL
jgi:hypothetical protein